GKVIKGTGTGSSLGFPTINVALNRVKPAISGVYATNTLINGSLYFGVAYVNSCYFKGIKAENHISVYLFDFQGELFGSYITIDLIHKLRDEYNVTTPDQAKKEMHKDCRVVKQHISLSNIITASSNKGSALSVTP
ncbi:MAG: riboflavin kinase, partial [Cellvibrionales bacterium]|nr:riboflavin kinase [Cellvibrionales bacterium]